MFALSFVLSWLSFALIWWLIAVTHGDLEEMHLPGMQGMYWIFFAVNQFRAKAMSSLTEVHQCIVKY